MEKTTNISVRLEPEIKERAELILDKLGIPLSNAVNIFLRQVVMQNGIPFDIKLPETKPIGIADLSEEDLNLELEKGYEDYVHGSVKGVAETFSDIRKDYDI